MIQENKFVAIDIPIQHLKISIENILNELGEYETGLDEYLRKLVTVSVQDHMKLIKSWSGYIVKRIAELNSKDGLIKIDNVSFNIGKIIASQLEDSEYLVMFVCTIGNSLEKLSRELFKKGEGLEGYITNIHGSEAVESLAAYTHDFLKKQMLLEKFIVTNRFSPGYCGWNIKEQFKLFGFFPSDLILVQLTDTALMNPVKSVSGFIGFGNTAKFQEYPCKKCNEKDCLYRKKTS